MLAGFGLIKKKFETVFCSSVFDVAEVVYESSEVGTNIPVITGLPDGTVTVPSYH